MKQIAKMLLASVALSAATLMPAHAELDVAALKAGIEKSFEADYPKLDALYKDIHAHPYDMERWNAANNGGPPLPANHSPLFAPVPKPTIQTGVTAMTLAVLSAFDQHARGK